jgi:uncharacterized membrane protein YdbT with pleckstrin-like domain
LSFAERHLIQGETIQYQTKLHWIVMLSHVVIATVLIVIGVALLIIPWSSANGGEASLAPVLRWAGAASLLVGAIFLGVGIVRRNATVMVLTNKRVIVKTGLASRRTIELLLSRIESIAVEEPAMGRVFGYGTVVIRGTGGTPEIFEKISHPLEFREQVQSQISSGQKQT